MRRNFRKSWRSSHDDFRGATMIAHNAAFDFSVWRACARCLTGRVLSGPQSYLCSVKMAQTRLAAVSARTSSNVLAEHLGLQVRPPQCGGGRRRLRTRGDRDRQGARQVPHVGACHSGDDRHDRPGRLFSANGYAPCTCRLKAEFPSIRLFPRGGRPYLRCSGSFTGAECPP